MTQFWSPHDWDKFEWIDVTQPSATELAELAARYHLHAHTVADCLEPDHLPKYEILGKTGFVITRKYAPKDKNTDTVQGLTSKVAMFFDEKRIITIHRLPQAFLSEIKEKQIDNGVCEHSTTLVLRIIEGVLQSYLEPGEQLSDEIDHYETQIFLQKRMPDLVEKLYYLKRKASVTKKIIKLTEEVIVTLEKQFGPSQAMEELWDMYTKVETLYEQIVEDAHNLTNTYLSLSAQRTNEVMRVLTIFSVFFMPLTFIAGIYGMNFDWMPELRVWWGYPLTLGAMLAVSVLIFIWFYRKRWI
jgi:magnesium transporter